MALIWLVYSQKNQSGLKNLFLSEQQNVDFLGDDPLRKRSHGPLFWKKLFYINEKSMRGLTLEMF